VVSSFGGTGVSMFDAYDATDLLLVDDAEPLVLQDRIIQPLVFDLIAELAFGRCRVLLTLRQLSGTEHAVALQIERQGGVGTARGASPARLARHLVTIAAVKRGSEELTEVGRLFRTKLRQMREQEPRSPQQARRGRRRHELSPTARELVVLGRDFRLVGSKRGGNHDIRVHKASESPGPAKGRSRRVGPVNANEHALQLTLPCATASG
jgi:hypothetical protein